VAGKALSGKAAGSIAAGSAGAKLMRRLATSTLMRRISPARCPNSRTSSLISTQSPSWKLSTSSRPSVCSSSSVAEITLLTPEQTLAFSRLNLKVAPPPAVPASWISTRYRWFSTPR
jgi:hypothetical protein